CIFRRQRQMCIRDRCGLAQLPEQLSCLMIPLDAKRVRYFTLFYCSDNPQCHLKAMDKLGYVVLNG
ncbi:hypothetical protein, partial [Endozoicomonas sp.]|uniref:hypothetical protein n=1 Tax=Endozoicomonas sp. TaxID=1892382 RepID=UPI00383BF040